ncbi:MAG TPA: hypothetical protein VHZ73_06980 [Vicinamibacterales bacterium]|jgi:hypothetical protein|nr:hypothetical protein [Vicinamibacterales bacterium]
MRFVGVAALLCTCAVSVACNGNLVSSGGNLFKQYEYEEDVYLSLDGAATIYVNGSLAALNTLRGSSFDASPDARFKRDDVRAFFTSPVTHVTSVSSSRRSGRQFAHVRVEAPDIRQLATAPAFAWSRYEFALRGTEYDYRQTVGAPAFGTPAAGVNWSGRELVVFRLHVPSNIIGQSTGEHLRGNILVWEQTLADRLQGKPIALAVQMETESILAHALLLFAGTALAVVVAFAGVVWWIMRRGAPAQN